MGETTSILTSIDSKVDRLINRCVQLQDSNNKLSEEKAALEEKLKERDREIEELHNKNKMLKMATALTGSGEEQSEAKQRINELVREIDKCIALLNR